MKIVFYVLGLLNCIYCFSQIKNGSILYGKVSAKAENSATAKDFAVKIEKLHQQADKIDYTLNFIGKEAYFFANPILLEDNAQFASLVIVGGGKLKYYQNDETKEYREYQDTRRTGITIVEAKQNYEWTLVNETKTIDGYACMKATSPSITEEGKIITDPRFNIIAWYAPQVTVNLGPIGYGGLPGLIMELQQPMMTFFVKSIKLNLEKDPFIDRLNNIKVITSIRKFC